MRGPVVRLLCAALAGLSLTGCAAAARFAGLTPPAATAQPGQSASLRSLTFSVVGKPKVQLGVDIDFYAYTGENVLADARSTIGYVKRLGANSVSISFPVFETSKHSSAVGATSETPSPSELAIVASVAEKAGLYVSIRPLMDQASIGGLSRTLWQPSDLAAWFASYSRFLLPYAKMAQRAKIPELINAAEFTQFQTSGRWRSVNNALRSVYTGAIAYSSNWGVPLLSVDGGTAAAKTVDAYAPADVPPGASVARLTASWNAYDRSLPQGIVQTEVGIAAVAGAYNVPYQFSWPGARLNPLIQTRWFTAACAAAATNRLGGVYFWNIGLGQALNVPPDQSNPASWVDSPGAQAISGCFASLAAATR